MNNKTYTFVFFGIVGSGKGTQVKLLEKYLKESGLANDIVSTSTGEEYRKLIEKGNYTSQLVKTKIEKGELQPDFLTISVFTNILISSLGPTTSLIADAFPRTIEQSQSFESAMNFYGRNEVHIIHIEIGEEEAIKRMKLRGRSDDTDLGIAKRLEVYKNDVIPAMNYFKNKPGYIFHAINGEQPIDDVWSELKKSLNL
jgi:adenylate kinase